MEAASGFQESFASVFDIRRNWKHLTNRPALQEPVIDGVRAIAILWVVAMHMVFYQLRLFPAQVRAIFGSSFTAWMQNGTLGVDLFFVISGYLMGSILFGEMRRTNGLGIARFYVRRFLRLMPVYLVAMALALYLLHGARAEHCWANLLYVNNFLPVNQQYMPYCWSLAIEEQFYLLLPPFLLVFLGPGKGRVRILIGLMLLSVAIRFSVIHVSGIAELFRMLATGAARVRAFDVVYDKPWMRFGGLLAGVAAAYLSCYFTAQLKRFFSRTRLVTAISLLCAAILVHVALTPPGASFFDRIPLLARELWWASFRDAFSVAAVFSILAAIHAPWLFGGWVRRFLSWKGFYPVAQLSYSIYLVHEMLFTWLFPRIAPLFAVRLGAHAAIAVDGAIGFAISLAIAACFYVTIERPCMRMRSYPAVLGLIDFLRRRRVQAAAGEA